MPKNAHAQKHPPSIPQGLAIGSAKEVHSVLRGEPSNHEGYRQACDVGSSNRRRRRSGRKDYPGTSKMRIPADFPTDLVDYILSFARLCPCQSFANPHLPVCDCCKSPLCQECLVMGCRTCQRPMCFTCSNHQGWYCQECYEPLLYFLC